MTSPKANNDLFMAMLSFHIIEWGYFLSVTFGATFSQSFASRQINQMNLATAFLLVYLIYTYLILI
jgi:hypothetical protein